MYKEVKRELVAKLPWANNGAILSSNDDSYWQSLGTAAEDY